MPSYLDLNVRLVRTVDDQPLLRFDWQHTTRYLRHVQGLTLHDMTKTLAQAGMHLIGSNALETLQDELSPLQDATSQSPLVDHGG